MSEIKRKEWKNQVRQDIEQLIISGDLKGLLDKAGELHGHLCSYLAYGVKAGYIAVRDLEAKSTGMEKVIAIVETNNCFSDGVQIVTGCTFGNNGLIFRDFGKTAVTVAKRDGKAIRLVLNPDFEADLNNKYPEASNLWDKIIVKREKATTEEQEKLMRLFAEMSEDVLKVSQEKMFRLKRLKITIPEYAPIFNSVNCSVCGEKVMETRARVKDGKPTCISCTKTGYYVLDGRGISIQYAVE